MVETASTCTPCTSTQKRKKSIPPDGYVCSICSEPGHWIQQCPQKRKRKKTNPGHIHIPGVDPSEADIEKARNLQKIKPPRCFCGINSRLKKVKRTKSGEESRAIGNYFFFCSKGKFDEGKCKFARPVEDELKPKKERMCTFFAKTGVCKKGDKCLFSHGVKDAGAEQADEKKPTETETEIKQKEITTENSSEKNTNDSGDKASERDTSSDNSESSSDSSTDSSSSGDESD